MTERLSPKPHYDVELRWDSDDACYVVSVPDLPGCMTHGETLEEAAAAAEDAIVAYLESLAARGLPLPRIHRSRSTT